jgi:hypothetical protein
MTENGGEPPVKLGQEPTLSKQFEDISDAHQRARKTVEGAIDEIARDGNPTPPSIRGPLRSGKTALQYHMFVMHGTRVSPHSTSRRVPCWHSSKT